MSITPSDYYNCVCYYILQNGGTVNPSDFLTNLGLFTIFFDGVSTYSISSWNVNYSGGGSGPTGPMPAPTISQLEAYDRNVVLATVNQTFLGASNQQTLAYYNGCAYFYINQYGGVNGSGNIPDPTKDNSNLFVLTPDGTGGYNPTFWYVFGTGGVSGNTGFTGETGGYTGTGGAYFYPISEPTFTLFQSYSPTGIQAYLVSALEAQFALYQSTVRTQYPQTAFLETMFFNLCTANPSPLPMTTGQYQTFMFNSWCDWAEAGYPMPPW